MLQQVSEWAPSTHLPMPTKPVFPLCLISGYVDQKYKASILTSLFKHCLHPHLTIHRLYPFKAPFLVYTTQKSHSYKLTERLNSNETSERKTLFLNRMNDGHLNSNSMSWVKAIFLSTWANRHHSVSRLQEVQWREEVWGTVCVHGYEL